MNYQTTEELETYTKQILHIPFVNFNGIDPNICKAIIETLKEAFLKYPLLKNSICAIGSEKDIEAQINLIYSCEEEYEGWLDLNIQHSYFFSCIAAKSEKEVLYCGMILGEALHDYTLRGLNKSIEQGIFTRFHTSHSRSVRELIWHEVGHIMDFFLNISTRQEFLELINSMDVEQEISRYAMKNEMETLAEAFAEYHATKKPNKTILTIVSYVLKDYQQRELKTSEIFDIAKAYKFRTF